MGNRSEDILELIGTNESQYSRHWSNDLLSWLGDREDAELVEILRGAASTLAYRMVGEVTKPSPEIFETALQNVATAFKQNCKGILDDRD